MRGGGGDLVMAHSLTHSLTPLLVRFVTAGYAVRAPFKFSIKVDMYPRPNIILDSYFPVKL